MQVAVFKPIAELVFLLEYFLSYIKIQKSCSEQSEARVMFGD